MTEECKPGEHRFRRLPSFGVSCVDCGAPGDSTVELSLTDAEDIAERTAKAVQYGCRNMATDLATLLDELTMPEGEAKKAMVIEDATETFLRTMSWMAAYTYGLCLLLRKDVVEAGKYFRKEEVQSEMRARAISVCRTVLQR